MRLVTALWAAAVVASLAALALTLVAAGNLAHGDLASEPGPVGRSRGVRHARRAHRPPGRQHHRLDHAGRGRRAGVSRDRFGVRGDRGRDLPWVAPGGRSRWARSPSAASPPSSSRSRSCSCCSRPGRCHRGRWRPVAAAGLTLAGLTTAGLVVHPRLVELLAPGGVSLSYPNPLAVHDLGPVVAHGPGRHAERALGGVPAVPGGHVRLARRPVPGRRPAAAAAGQVARPDRRRVRRLPAHRPAGPRRRPGLADHGRVHGHRAHRAVRHPGGDGHRDLAAPAVRHRPHHQPRRGLRPALGRRHRGVRGHRPRHRDVRRPPQRPAAHDRRGGHDRAAVPAAAAPRPAVREPPRLRPAGHARNRRCPTWPGTWPGSWTSPRPSTGWSTVLAGATGADRAEAWIRVGPELRPAAIWPSGSPPSAAVPLDADDGLPAFEQASRGGGRHPRRRAARRPVPAQARKTSR